MEKEKPVAETEIERDVFIAEDYLVPQVIQEALPGRS